MGTIMRLDIESVPARAPQSAAVMQIIHVARAHWEWRERVQVCWDLQSNGKWGESNLHYQRQERETDDENKQCGGKAKVAAREEWFWH